jgi:hypothetical protein
MTGTLAPWIARLLGIEIEPGEGTVWSLEHVWALAPWVTLILAVLVAVYVLGIYGRENREASRRFRTALACMRLGVLAIVALMIAQVMLLLQRTGLPYVAMLVDDSQSMSIVDRYETDVREALLKQLQQVDLEEPSRLNLAKSVLLAGEGRLLRQIARGHKLRLYATTGRRSLEGEDLESRLQGLRDLQPAGQSTRLGAAVEAVLEDLRGTAPAAVVLLTDGINTDGPTLADAAELARRRGVPLFTVGLGDQRPVRDLKIEDLLVEEVVFVDDVVHFDMKLSGTGYAGRTAKVVLRHKDKPEVLAEIDVAIADDEQTQQVRLPYRPPTEGRFEFVVEVLPQEGELQLDNNRQQRVVQVRKEQIRVLLVNAYPSFEFRYLRNMLQRDDTIQLHTVLQEADLGYAEQDAGALAGFPVRSSELSQYDVIILGDVNPALLSETMMQHVADFVDRPGQGGAVVFLSGPRYMPLAYRDTPLEKLLPIDLNTARAPLEREPFSQGFGVRLTDLGLASPSTQLGDRPGATATIWENLPPLYWMIEAPDVKPGARVLAVNPSWTTADGRPLPVICMQYVGAGRVLFHATDATWRWRFRTGDVFFARYWVQTIRYLSRAKLASGNRSAQLSSDRREYRLGEPIRLRVRFADPRQAPAEDDGVTVVVEHRGHKTRRLRLRRAAGAQGTFEGTLNGAPLGRYHAWMAIPALKGQPPAADFEVTAPPGELAQVRMAAASLRRAAEQTKGEFYTALSASRLIDDLPEGRQVPVESLPPRPLWNRWPLLALLLGLLIGEWLLRKRGGMV